MLRLTIDVFSGRPNPVIYLDGREADDVLKRVRPGERIPKKEQRPVPPSPLGYRGIVIEQLDRKPVRGLPQSIRVANGDLFGKGLAHRASDEFFEEFVCGSTGLIRRVPIDERFPGFVLKEIARLKEIRRRRPWKPRSWPLRHRCACAPLYEPQWWNDGGQRQGNNNCYNYGTNYRTDTFAQPGLGSGQMYGAITCAEVKGGAVRDDLIDAPKHRNTCPKEGHLAALVVGPGIDFHWYRKGRNGYWTHKPGGTQVTNIDNSNNLISDPRTANRGFYTDFCGFMIVMHGHTKIE